LASRKDNVIDLASRETVGRRQFIEQLFAQHAPAVRLFLRGRSIPADEIEDFVQELFTRLLAVERLEERMTEARGSVRSFLLTMAHNLIVDRQRKRQVRKAHAEAQRAIEVLRVEERTPERIVAAQLELETIKAVLLSMPLHWQVALVLQRLRDMSYEDIGLHMGVTVKQVEHYLRRGMRRIHKARRKIEAAGERSC
jgi:RNA polymerase sigma-70 factor (ECF subfamily)